MNGINEVVKYNSKWLKTAEAMCGDYDLAQDLVQDMYINLMEKEVINEALVCITLKNLWLGTFRYKKTHDTFSIDSEEFAGELQSTQSEFEIEDHQLKYIKRFNELPYRQQELILESYDFSVREIADKLNINRTYVHRQIHEGLKHVLKGEYINYENSNLKHLLVKKEEPEEILTDKEFNNWVDGLFKNDDTMTDKEFNNWVTKVTTNK